ncbi:hypothetical protein N566_24665 [Streptomycetaceae bacterium MP113-05]|nr:hypothetical protein N566_24665 [Streptomycetaceae bacterium MP113-05]
MPATKQSTTRRHIALAATVLALSLAVVVALLTTGGDESSGRSEGSSPVSTPSARPDDSSGQGPDLSHLARRDAGDPMALGQTDAPVVLIEYADFQCPFCGKFARETEPELIRDYVKKGVLRIEWRNFPVFGQESEQAALAAWAAAQQNTFWEFHELIYSQERARNSGVFTPDNLVDFARKAGVPDLEKFRNDMNSKAAREALQRDKEEGYRLGVTSTPAFLVNNTPILGAMPAPTFEKAVEKAAKEAKR